MKKTMKTLITSAITATILASTTSATILTNVTVSSSSTAHSAPYAVSNITDRTGSDYASSNQGINTFIEYSFGGTQSFDTYIHVDRNSITSEIIDSYTLTFADTTTKSVSRTGLAGSGTIDYLDELITTTSVKFDVDTLGGGGTSTTSNVGATETYFLRTPSNMTLETGVTIEASSAHGASVGASAILDGKIAHSHTGAYLSNNGTNTYVDFDLGSEMQVGGFDYIDNLAEWRVKSFDMIFSTDNVFDGSDTTRSYTGPGTSQAAISTQSDEFAGANINARYVRFDVTDSAGWAGINEMRFYSVNQVPEPSSVALLGLGGLALILRKRRA